MSKSMYSHEQIIQAGQFTPEDMNEILQRRRDHNRLGYAYQMAFVRLANRFPAQQPLEILPELLTYVALQLGIKTEVINLLPNDNQQSLNIDKLSHYTKVYAALRK